MRLSRSRAASMLVPASPQVLAAVADGMQRDMGELLAAVMAPASGLHAFDFLGGSLMPEVDAVISKAMPGNVAVKLQDGRGTFSRCCSSSRRGSPFIAASELSASYMGKAPPSRDQVQQQTHVSNYASWAHDCTGHQVAHRSWQRLWLRLGAVTVRCIHECASICIFCQLLRTICQSATASDAVNTISCLP